MIGDSRLEAPFPFPKEPVVPAGYIAVNIKQVQWTRMTTQIRRSENFVAVVVVNVTYVFLYQLLCSPNEVWEHIGFTLFLTIIIKVFRFQRKTLLFLLGFFFPIIFFFLTDFVPPISRKRLDRFS